jgi:small nuclear ribonucleoprotein (snRNP)-like protein
VLKGFDQLMNLVLDEVQEYMRGMAKIFSKTGDG